MESSVDYRSNILASGKSIYDPIDIGDPNLWIPSEILEAILNASLVGTSLAGLPLRTRSKVVKELICDAIGYPRPGSFRKTNPRFVGQNFDTYIQKSNNLQVWNEELDPTRRYVIVGVGKDDKITKVRVVTGEDLARVDTTGTLTQKYQARLVPTAKKTELVSTSDTSRLLPLLSPSSINLSYEYPIALPQKERLLSISEIYSRLKSLVGATFKDVGIDQERNRGAELHKLVCQRLGYLSYADDGRFPDIKHQLLEVKLQTSPTIDLGLVTPASKAPLDIPKLSPGVTIRHCDVRYALIYGALLNGEIQITNVYLTTGESFFNRFPQFGGKVLNKKIQIPLPKSFFD